MTIVDVRIFNDKMKSMAKVGHIDVVGTQRNVEVTKKHV